MTDTIIYGSRRDRRRAARKSLAAANAASAGRATAAVLAASGLVISSTAAANATEESDEGRESATVELNTSALNVERASTVAAEAVSADPDVELSFDRPAVSSEAAPEPIPESAPEPVVEATPASHQVEQPAQTQPDPQHSESSQQTHQHSHQAEQPAQTEPPQQRETQQAPQTGQQTHQHSHQAEQPAQTEPPQQRETQQAPQTRQQGSQQQSQSSNGASAASGNQERPANSGGSSSVVSAAYAAVGTPYKWGGNTTSGFDCSGLINWAYNQAGRGGLPRTTYGMDASLPRVSSPQPGDIVLANNNGHGGIYVGNGQVISATSSGGVRLHGMNESWHQVNAILRPGA
ncbi:NlpC/P60 family protein [Garicola koreensis]|uniref:Cell wall-associated NlpC family hydrolase n=1 Tax=Garicola koreensis TaxID=1262554 RepID=A0A7W5TVU0_9MICC|nr:cell wall-associated NlpC family hydrolase [Garicola koreensis]